MNAFDHCMWRPICKDDYPLLLTLDKKLYPTDSPVTEEILDVWFARNPEFGMVFCDRTEAASPIAQTRPSGFFVCIPLCKSAWERLVAGKMAESDIQNEDVFDGSRDSELFLHIYHLEKDIGGRIKKEYGKVQAKGWFTHEGLGHLAALVKQIQKLALTGNNESLVSTSIQLRGISALSVSASGIKSCENMGLREGRFVSNEYIVESHCGKKKHVEVLTFSTETEAQESCRATGKRIVNRTKMLATRRNGEKMLEGGTTASLNARIWSYF